MTTPSPRVQVPRTVAHGEVIEIKTLIDHPMETGLRHDSNGEVIPRKIINRFTCRYNDEVVFQADLHEAVAANPFIVFSLRATASGRLDFIWTEDGGAVYALNHTLLVA
ncbi:thiosulfate oxidation carrier complex protein SoxZ [Bradyrhizobium prioriisuperbiae]|uniref:thiosulfate oxidation carrier complex protein SoxZ n=1 Tax=Bradyrhizobium prioriisuperbiae TaxID=2854389 RepID=UPI0028EC0DD4|nr:thiosulfate oxidation carrier complex protein SoxZ [Bradyrhizobium prioritasuperba]